MDIGLILKNGSIHPINLSAISRISLSSTRRPSPSRSRISCNDANVILGIVLLSKQDAFSVVLTWLQAPGLQIDLPGTRNIATNILAYYYIFISLLGLMIFPVTQLLLGKKPNEPLADYGSTPTHERMGKQLLSLQSSYTLTAETFLFRSVHPQG